MNLIENVSHLPVIAHSGMNPTMVTYKAATNDALNSTIFLMSIILKHYVTGKQMLITLCN